MKFAALLALGLFIAIVPAVADTEGAAATDVVKLNDGSELKGTIVSQDRGSITIRTATGEQTVDRLIVTSVNDSAAAPADRIRPSRAEGRTVRRGPEATEAMLAWVDLCIGKLASDDDGVRQGAMSALRAAGDTARDKLSKAATGDNTRIAESAEKLLTALDRRGTARPSDSRTTRARGESRDVARAARAANVELQLTGEQRGPFADIVREFRDEESAVKAAQRAGKIDSEMAMQQLAKLKTERDAKLTGVLDEAQMKKFLARETAQPSR